MTKTGDKSIIYIRRWIGFSAFMVFAMAVIGAITRLTESGLSMVEWRPLMGALPPLSEGEWNRVFALYQQSPQYQKINMGMELTEFKNIFFWEWLHRLWGRVIGIVYAVPMAFFWVKGMIPKGYKKHLIALLFLGGMQGVVGWIMVQSGLIDNPAVSHYRLAAHLMMAYIIFGWLMWLYYRLSPSPHHLVQAAGRGLKYHGALAGLFLFVTVTWGAFVAGVDAGMVYNEWPHMGQGRFVPSDMWFLEPVWLNPFENAAAIQFTHRWIAIVTLCVIAGFAWRVRSHALGFMVFIQVGLGIATLLTQVSIPLAAMHQAGAFILFALLLDGMSKISGSSRHKREDSID